MGCLNSKPQPKTEREPEEKEATNSAKKPTIGDIFAVSASPRGGKLPPVEKPPKGKKKHQIPSSSQRHGRKHSVHDADIVEMALRGMVQYQDRQGYVAVFDTRVLQKYYVKGLIGQGRCSDIFRAEHKASKQPYAIKAIDKLRALDSCDVELAVLRRVSHPNILELVEVFDCPDRVFFVIELATGGDLLDRMSERGQFSEQEACHIVKMLLEGLKYLHSLAITHCDLRPENILFYHPGKDARAIITDFGQAVECRDLEGVVLTAPLHNCSPEYLPPEILARVPASFSVDLWSIGVLAFTMLSGSLPFADDNRPNLMRRILRAQYSFHEKSWEGVSTQSKNFIDRLLIVDASSRMTASQALRHAWIFATLGQQSGDGGNVGGKANVFGEGGGDNKNRPESAGMFSLGDVSIHSLRLAGSSTHNHHSKQNQSNNSHARNNLRSAGTSSIRSQDTTDVDSTVDTSTVVGGAETDDNESSIAEVKEVIGMGVTPRRVKTTVISE